MLSNKFQGNSPVHVFVLRGCLSSLRLFLSCGSEDLGYSNSAFKRGKRECRDSTSFFLKSPLKNKTHYFCSHSTGNSLSHHLDKKGAVKYITWLRRYFPMATLLYERESTNNYGTATCLPHVDTKISFLHYERINCARVVINSY